jgi:hypothetical protein
MIAGSLVGSSIMKLRNDRDPSPDLVTEDEQRPSNDATKTSCAVITAFVSKSTSKIGAYRYAPPNPDDPFATEEDDAGGEIIPCPITIVGDLRQRREEFQDKVQILEFVEFEGLPEFMTARRQGIERKQETVLKEVHERFQTIVRDVLIHRKLCHSVLGENDDPDSSSGTRTTNTSLQVGLYATPNVRLGRGKYASFLHSDSTFLPIAKRIGGPENNNSFNSNTPRVMVNVWIILNDRPPSNQLMFYQSLLQHTCQSGTKLHGQYDHIQGETLVYDQDMCWGSFYCFVSGEAKPDNETGRVLLHGAVDIPGGGGGSKTKGTNHRKSIELRYLV